MKLIDADNFSNEFNSTIYNKLQKEYLNSTADDKTKDVADFVTTDIMIVFNDLIDNASTVEPEELKRVRNICEHWNDKSSSFVSACNAFEDILHIFKMGVGDMRGKEE